MPRGPGRRTTSEADLAQLDSLRELIIGPEPTTVEGVAAVLPEAVAQASATHTRELGAALEPAMTRAVHDVARHDPETFGRILAPTIGTAVRRAVSEAVAAIMQRMNEVLDHSLSVHGLAWRLEARRTGRPLSEVVLAHTLLYRVEWVVLIHSETSLVLEQVTLPDAPAKAPDQVSAMLQAIGSFVSEAFHVSSPGGDLHSVEVGDITLWIERDPQLTLAAAIRGSAPRGLRDVLHETLDRIHADHTASLAHFAAERDASSFATARPLLEDCLRREVTPTPRRAQRLIGVLALAAVTALSVLMYRSCEAERADAELRAAYRAVLTEQPGVAVLSMDRVDGRYHISALTDPRSPPLNEVIAAASLPAVTFDLRPFSSADPRLGPPLAVVDTAIRELEALRIEFPIGAASLPDADQRMLHRAAELIRRAHREAARHYVQLCVEVIGHADESGNETLNQRLRTERAASTLNALAALGVPRELLSYRPADVVHAQPVREARFRAALRPQSSPPEACGP